MTDLHLHVGGMACSLCAANIADAIGRMKGVRDVSLPRKGRIALGAGRFLTFAAAAVGMSASVLLIRRLWQARHRAAGAK